MATAFNKNYTELSNVNSGNQLQNGDDILGDHVNAALQNTAHFKELTNNTVIRSASLSNNTIHLVLATKTNTGNVVTTNLDIDISNLGGVKQNVTSGGYTSTIYNGGDRVAFSTGDSNDFVYTFRLTSSGAFELEQNIYDPDSGTSDITTINLLKYPCYIRLGRTDCEILINTIGKGAISNVSSLLDIIPNGRNISATGHFKFSGDTNYKIVKSVNVTPSLIEIGYIQIDFSNSSVTYGAYSYSPSNFTITGVIKVF